MAVQGGLLALDLGTITGFAIGRVPPRPLTPLEANVAKPPQPESGIFIVAESGTAAGRYGCIYRDWLYQVINERRPGGIIFEAPILHRLTNPNTVRRLNGLVFVTQMLAFEHRIHWIREGQPSTVKKHISGNGGPGKEHVKAAILARGWQFVDDNAADALALWCYGCDLYVNERAAAAA